MSAHVEHNIAKNEIVMFFYAERKGHIQAIVG